MENKDIVNNEEVLDVIEVAEECIPARKMSGWKVLGIVGGAVAVVGLAYMYIAKPIIKKVKAAKADEKEYNELAGEMAEKIEAEMNELSEEIEEE